MSPGSSPRSARRAPGISIRQQTAVIARAARFVALFEARDLLLEAIRSGHIGYVYRRHRETAGVER
mgnify:CR=1 FL=1